MENNEAADGYGPSHSRSPRRSSLPPWEFLEHGSDSTAEALGRIAKRKRFQEERILFECGAQAEAPSKDYCSIVVTERGVIWRKWKISLRGVTSGSAPVPQPVEECMTHFDFRCDDELKDEVKRVFGNDAFEKIEYIVSGCRDHLTRLSDNILLNVVLKLDLHSINNLSQANHIMRKFCNSDHLWSALYSMYQVSPNREIQSLASEMSWKALFYMSKLQLQKELSRRRRHPSTADNNLRHY